MSKDFFFHFRDEVTLGTRVLPLSSSSSPTFLFSPDLILSLHMSGCPLQVYQAVAALVVLEQHVDVGGGEGTLVAQVGDAWGSENIGACCGKYADMQIKSCKWSRPLITFRDDRMGGVRGVKSHPGVSSRIGRGQAGWGGGGRFWADCVLLFRGLGELGTGAFGAGGFPTSEGVRHLENKSDNVR